MNKFTRFLLVVIVASMALWSVPALVRDSSALLPWTASYDDLHLSRAWHGTLVVQDAQSGQPRLLGLLHGVVGTLGGTVLVLRIVGLLGGIAACVGLWLVLRKSTLPLRTCLLAVVLFGASGAAITLFGVPSSSGFAVGVAMLALGLVVQESFVSSIAGVVLGSAVAIGGPVPALHMALMGTAALVLQRRYRWALAFLLVPFGAGLLVWWPLVTRVLPDAWWSLPVFGALAEFGARPGIGVMEWLLGVIGAGVLWTRSHKRLALIVAALVVYTSTSVHALAFGAPLWSVLAAIAIMHLYEREWRYPELKTLAMFAVGCGVLLSLLTVITTSIAAPPRAALVEGLGMLTPDDVVLTQPSIADWVVAWSSARVVYDDHGSSQERRARDQTLASLWYGRDVRNATIVLDALGVDTILVTRAMRQGGVWTRDEEGFLFLLENSEMFKKRFSNGEVEVWNYTPRSNT